MTQEYLHVQLREARGVSGFDHVGHRLNYLALGSTFDAIVRTLASPGVIPGINTLPSVLALTGAILLAVGVYRAMRAYDQSKRWEWERSIEPNLPPPAEETLAREDRASA